MRIPKKSETWLLISREVQPDFPGASNAGDMGSIPGQETKIPGAMWLGQKKKKKKKKQASKQEIAV